MACRPLSVISVNIASYSQDNFSIHKNTPARKLPPEEQVLAPDIFLSCIFFHTEETKKAESLSASFQFLLWLFILFFAFFLTLLFLPGLFQLSGKIQNGHSQSQQ